jgi:hypothetical protein
LQALGGSQDLRIELPRADRLADFGHGALVVSHAVV